MPNKILFIVLSVIVSLIISLYNINAKNFFNTNTVTKLINEDSNLILFPLEKFSGKKVKIIDNKDFDKKILDLDKSRFPYMVLDGLFEGTDGNLIATKSHKCPFYKKNKIPVSDFVNYKIIKSFDKIDKIIKDQLLQYKTDNKINLSEMSFRVTALIIGNVILEIESFETIYSLEESFTRLLHDLSDRPQLYSVLKIFKRTPIPKNIKILNDLKNISKIFNDIIEKKDNPLILEMEKQNSYDEIFNFLKFFFFAGFETTSNQLSFVMYMLSQNKKWQDEIYQETKSIKDYQSLEKCKFLNSFIFETLRIHPIVNTSTRTDKDTIYVFNVAKMNKIDGDNSFNPYRYLNETPEIYTFQAGTRQCIGKRLSLVEIQLFVIHFIKLFQIESHNDPKVAYSITKYLSPYLQVDISKRRSENKIKIKKPINKKVEEIKVKFKGDNYDLSEYIFKHPGGKFIIAALNNNDITEEFLSKHLDSIRANRVLQKFKNYQPNKDIFKTYQILDVNSFKIKDDFLLIKIKYDNECNSNQVLKNGNTVVFHQIEGFKNRCFSISEINKNDNTFTLFVKEYPNSLFLEDIKDIPNKFIFSFINSVYSNIKEDDVLISIGSGLGPFISYSNKCKVIGSFRGDYINEFKNYNINNLILANTKAKSETIYDLIDKLKISIDSNVYICGNNQFIDEIEKRYQFKNIFFDEW